MNENVEDTTAPVIISLSETVVRCPIHDEPMDVKGDRTFWVGELEHWSVRYGCIKPGCETDVRIDGVYKVGMSRDQRLAQYGRGIRSDVITNERFRSAL